MEWWQSIVLGIVQGLTEFLPVSSSGHIVIFKELMGVDAEGFLGFTVLVHFATVLSTLFVFWPAILNLLKGLFKFRYNDETDYVLKIVISMIPVGIVGAFFKDNVEALFGNGLANVAIGLVVTALLLILADNAGRFFTFKPHRNGISFVQAFIVGLGQAVAVAPGLSRSGTTIATGLVSGVKKESMAQFSFLMVLAPIIGEQLLDLLGAVSGGESLAAGLSPVVLALGFVTAFFSGLFACKAMIAIVRKSRLGWFALYCLLAAILIFVLG